MTKASKIIAYVCIVLALVGAIGFIAKYTSGFTSSFKTFYISIDGKDIMISSEGYFLESNESMKVDIHYTFNDSDAEVSGYTVKIIPNVVDGRDFDFTVGDLVYSF